MPREFVTGGVVDIDNGTQKMSWGTGPGSLTILTMGFWCKLRAAGSASYDVVWGFSNQRAFFILDGVSTRRMRFSVYTSGAERTSGLCTALDLDTWYFIIGGYDPAAGAGNLFIRVYESDGTLYSAPSPATVTGALDTSGSTPLVFGSDTVKNPDQPIDAQGKNFRIWNRLLSSTECDLAATEVIDRTGLVLETKCNTPGVSQLNSGVNPSIYNATLSGGARTVPEPPTELARSRQAVTNRVSSIYDSGYSILLNGSNQYCSRNDTVSSSDGTIFIRFKTRSLTSNQTLIGISVAGSDNNNLDFTLISGALRVKIKNTADLIRATLPKITGDWHSILWKGGTGGNQIFLDGVDVTSLATYANGTSASTQWTSAFASAPTRITNGTFMISSTTNYFNGWLDDFKMWDRKLTDIECQKVHAGAPVSRTGLFWEWLYSENTGTSVADSSPSANHAGTLTSSAVWSAEKAISPRVEI